MDMKLPFSTTGMMLHIDDSMDYEVLSSSIESMPKSDKTEDEIVLEAMAHPIGSPKLSELAKGKEYYNAMRTGCEIKTGLISTANFADAFRTALEADQDVIYLSLSKNISGTYNSARLAAEELLEEYGGKRKIRLVDSLNASLAQGILAIYASEMRDRGMNVDEAADLLETYVSKMNGVFTVGDLKYLSRTGRIKGSVAVVGNMLKIKPILRGSEDLSLIHI